jgi:hypothetical protein
MTGPDHAEFAVRGSLHLEGASGRRIINYWFHFPFFWRVEQDEVLLLQTGQADHVKALDQMIFDMRLLSMPRILARYLGLRGDETPFQEDHSPTGRPAYRLALPDNYHTSVLVDNETAFVLQFQGIYKGQAVKGSHYNFEVTETLDPALFGETSLDAQGYYYGLLG